MENKVTINIRIQACRTLGKCIIRSIICVSAVFKMLRYAVRAHTSKKVFFNVSYLPVCASFYYTSPGADACQTIKNTEKVIPMLYNENVTIHG